MSVFTPSLDARWKSTKANFETITGQHKPKEKLAGVVKTGHTGLSKNLKAAEDAGKSVYQAVTDMKGGKIKPDKAKAKLAEYENLQKAYSKSAKAYTDLLAAEITKEKDLAKDVKSLWERGLKMLQKELASFDSILVADIAKEKQNFAAELKDAGAEEKSVLLFKTNMKKALDNALARAAKGKAMGAAVEGKSAEIVKSLVNFYNEQIVQKAGRDVWMQLVIAKKVTGLNATPDAGLASIGTWGDQKTHKLPGTASAADIRGKVAAFSTAVKGVQTWFAAATT